MLPTPVNDSLNASRARWGLPLWVVMLVAFVAGCFLWLGSFPEGELYALLVGVGIPLISKTLVSRDPQIYRLSVLALSFKSSYDPGKSADAMAASNW
jgi:hypothetical protein